MEYWWKWNHQVELGEYTCEEVEGFTGRIPFFLKHCIQKGKDGKERINLENRFFYNAFHEAAGFECQLQAKWSKDPNILRRYAVVVLPL
jgi:hypothetical protein